MYGYSTSELKAGAMWAASIVIVALAIIVAGLLAGNHATDSVTRRHAAGFEACSHADPAYVALCIAEVKR